MRLIYTFDDARLGKRYSNFLVTKGIENNCDIAPGGCRIWIKNEDKVPEAIDWLEQFNQDPYNAQFQPKSPPPPPEQATEVEASFTKEPLGAMNLFLLLLCCFIFPISQITAPHVESIPSNIPALPLLASPIKKTLLYDYPEAYTLIDKISNSFGTEDIQKLPPEGKQLLQQFQQTPYWQGIYGQIVDLLSGRPIQNTFAPMFEKIREGQVWRLFSPIFLHADIFHLIFNMIWLIVIGKQIEKRVGMARYLLLVLLAAIFSNTAQYLMSGPNFIGISGVLCAMVVFVWVRQRKAPWEGYFMQPATWSFFAFFVLLMFGIQLASFMMEVTMHTAFPASIANTAHLSGALMGYLLGNLNYFSASYR